MPEIRQVELDLNAFGHGTCVIDGVDVSSFVGRVTVDADSRGDTLTRVYLELAAGHQITAELEALVSVKSDPDAEILAFLRNCDAIALEAEAMAKLDGLNGTITSPTVAILATLQEWAAVSDDNDRT